MPGCWVSVRLTHAACHPPSRSWVARYVLEYLRRKIGFCICTVPLYDSLGESAVEYTVNHSQTAIVFAQSGKLGQLLKAVPATKANLKTVVYWGTGTPKEVASIEKEVSESCSSRTARGGKVICPGEVQECNAGLLIKCKVSSSEAGRSRSGWLQVGQDSRSPEPALDILAGPDYLCGEH